MLRHIQQFEPLSYLTLVQGFDTLGGVLPSLVAGYAWLFASQGGGRYGDGSPLSSTNIENAFVASAFIAIDVWLQRA